MVYNHNKYDKLNRYWAHTIIRWKRHYGYKLSYQWCTDGSYVAAVANVVCLTGNTILMVLAVQDVVQLQVILMSLQEL